MDRLITLVRAIECIYSWLLKNSVIGATFGAEQSCREFSFCALLGGDSLSMGHRLAEEPHQSLDVLRSRCQEELLADELQASQA
jgi:hypothetical protein